MPLNYQLDVKSQLYKVFCCKCDLPTICGVGAVICIIIWASGVTEAAYGLAAFMCCLIVIACYRRISRDMAGFSICQPMLYTEIEEYI